jgi:hypothetical protein
LLGSNGALELASLVVGETTTTLLELGKTGFSNLLALFVELWLGCSVVGGRVVVDKLVTNVVLTGTSVCVCCWLLEVVVELEDDEGSKSKSDAELGVSAKLEADKTVPPLLSLSLTIVGSGKVVIAVDQAVCVRTLDSTQTGLWV